MENTENTEPTLCNTKNCNCIPVKYRYLAVAVCQQCRMSMCADCLRAHNRSPLTVKHCVGDIVNGVLPLFSVAEKTPEADMALPAIKVELESEGESSGENHSSDDEDDVDLLWKGEEAQKDVLDDLYHCPSCLFRTPRRRPLYEHIRLHTGERPYKCPDCAYSARCFSTLQSHKRRHTDPRPFECTKCPYAARSMNTLQDHERHHGSDDPMKCTECDFAVRTERQFMFHARTHNGETPFFKCSQCECGARTENKLAEHVEKEHGRTAVENVKQELQSDGEISDYEEYMEEDEPMTYSSAITTAKEEPEEFEIDDSRETERDFTMTGNLFVNLGCPVVDGESHGS